MAKIVTRAYNLTVNTWADLQALPSSKKVDEAQVTVLDAIGDTRTLGGTVVYQYVYAFAGTPEEWMIISEINQETVTTVEEDLTIVNGQVTLSNVPNSGVLLDVVAKWTENGTDFIEDVSYAVSGEIVTVSTAYDGYTLSVKYLKNTSGKLYQLGTGTGGGVSSFTQLTDVPTTIAGYGITDAYTKSQVDSAIAVETSRAEAAEASIDAILATKADTSSLATVATTGNFSDLKNLPTTNEGYGITDAFSETNPNVIVVNQMLGVSNSVPANGGLLYGTQQGDSILVVDGTSDSGIWIASSGQWYRKPGFTDNGASLSGKYVFDTLTSTTHLVTMNGVTDWSNLSARTTAYPTNTYNINVEGSATKLATPVTIAGESFDGTTSINIPFANLSSIPTTIAGYGITDAYTKSEIDSDLNSINSSITVLQSTATTGGIKGAFDTVSGLDTLVEADLQEGWMYGIRSTNDVYVYSKSSSTYSYQPTGWTGGFIEFLNVADVTSAVANEASLRASADTVLTNTKADKATTLSGYGITDAYTKSQVDSAIAVETSRAESAEASINSTLATKANTSSLATVATTGNFSDLSSKPTTLSGYGITDALSVTGTAVSATKLATPRNINGQAFDGTADITIGADAVLPTQTGNSGKFLSTNGTASSWVSPKEVIALTDISDVAITTPTTGQTLTYNGTSWVNGTATSGGAINGVFYENSSTLTSNYTVSTGSNAMTTGPIAVANGATITVPNGSVLTII